MTTEKISIDGHLHLFEAVSESYPRDVHPLFPPELSSPVEKYITVMDENGIDYAVIVPLSAHDQYLAHCLAKYPGGFGGSAYTATMSRIRSKIWPGGCGRSA